MKCLRPSKLSIIIAGYSSLILAWFVLWLMLGDGTWWLTLVNRFVPFLFLPVPVLLGWIVYSRRSRLAIPLLIPIFIFVQLYHPYLFPRFVNRVNSEPSLKIMTYNVLYSNEDYDGVANVILTHQPDLVALQEVVPMMMDALVERLQVEYPYHEVATHNDFGMAAVFSRTPFTYSKIVDLQADRRAVIVKTSIHGQEVTFVSIHLIAYGLQWVKLKDIPAYTMERTRIQNRQAQIVLDQVSDEDGVVIVACDCNSKETSSSYRIFDEWFDNSARVAGWVLGGDDLSGAKQDTYLQHIDYVWYRGAITPTSVFRIIDSGGSDHLPVLAEFSMN